MLNIARGTGSGYNSLPTGTTMTGFSFSETPTFDAYGALSNDAYGSVYSVAYTRDAGGRVTQKVETISGTPTTTTYVYDGDSACTTGAPNDGRLCQATIGSTVYGPYTYDADGNRTDTGLTYDEQDRISSTGYTYSPGGRLSSKTIVPDTATYTYDVYGNLTHVNRPYSLPAIDYINDSQNRRVGKIVGGTYVQGFLYDDLGRLSAELDGSGNVISQFVYGMKPNVPEYMINTVSGTTTTYRLITDQLGSVIMVVNAASPTGTPAQVITYDPWGKILTDVENISNGNPAVSVFQPFGFAGGLHDRDAGGSFTNDGGWVRFGARDYDTNTGRWTSKDPIRFGGGLDVYAYCGNNPIDCIDPNGRLPPGSVPWEPIFPPQPLWDPNACTDQCDAAYATATDSCRYWGESPFGDICPGLPEAPATKEGFAQECIDEAEFAWSSCLAQCHGDPYFPGVPIPGATPRPYIPQWASNGRP
ncbi:MAG: RHS repeat-associated core domain-containing protein [Polyangiaceae bacterium]